MRGGREICKNQGSKEVRGGDIVFSLGSVLDGMLAADTGLPDDRETNPTGASEQRLKPLGRPSQWLTDEDVPRVQCMRPPAGTRIRHAQPSFRSSAFGGKVAMRHTVLPFKGMPRGCRSRRNQQLDPLSSRDEAPHQYSLGGYPQEPLRPYPRPGVAPCQ